MTNSTKLRAAWVSDGVFRALDAHFATSDWFAPISAATETIVSPPRIRSTALSLMVVGHWSLPFAWRETGMPHTTKASFCSVAMC